MAAERKPGMGVRLSGLIVLFAGLLMVVGSLGGGRTALLIGGIVVAVVGFAVLIVGTKQGKAG